mmetsp:Transcript_4164/g.10706  ORF Transcript_4164/g.10706 Transcript_4164/m.10706 type:complete len:215 (-) Transcript_4164:830-1474(-)
MRYSGSRIKSFWHKSAASADALRLTTSKSICWSRVLKKISSSLGVSGASPPQSGNFPTSIWYMRMPALQQSTDSLYLLSTTSGAMYTGVPARLERLRALSPGMNEIAKPKSEHFTFELGDLSTYKKFCGLISLYIIPLAWQFISMNMTVLMTVFAWFSGSALPPFIRSKSEPPVHKSITRCTCVSSSKAFVSRTASSRSERRALKLTSAWILRR